MQQPVVFFFEALAAAPPCAPLQWKAMLSSQHFVDVEGATTEENGAGSPSSLAPESAAPAVDLSGVFGAEGTPAWLRKNEQLTSIKHPGKAGACFVSGAEARPCHLKIGHYIFTLPFPCWLAHLVSPPTCFR